MSKIYFQDLVIEHVVKPSLKNSSITIKSLESIILKTPRVSDNYIQNLLHVKYSWIEKQLKKLQLHAQKEIELEHEVLLFGRVYNIDMSEVILLKKKLQRARSLDMPKILKCYDDFYKEYAKSYLPSLIEKYAKRMEVDYKELKFRKMRSRWGSCSSQRVITFNTKLMQVKRELIEYVVVHELAHLVHMNHSPAFYQLVEYYLPNSKALRKELKNIYI